MKWLALLLLALLQCSCTTEDHRALYRPDPLGGYGGSLVSQTSGAGLRSMPPPSAPVQHVEPAPATKPEFRY